MPFMTAPQRNFMSRGIHPYDRWRSYTGDIFEIRTEPGLWRLADVGTGRLGKNMTYELTFANEDDKLLRRVYSSAPRLAMAWNLEYKLVAIGSVAHYWGKPIGADSSTKKEERKQNPNETFKRRKGGLVDYLRRTEEIAESIKR